MRVIYLEVEDNTVDKVVNALKGLKVRFRMENSLPKETKRVIEDAKANRNMIDLDINEFKELLNESASS